MYKIMKKIWQGLGPRCLKLSRVCGCTCTCDSGQTGNHKWDIVTRKCHRVTRGNGGDTMETTNRLTELKRESQRGNLKCKNPPPRRLRLYWDIDWSTFKPHITWEFLDRWEWRVTTRMSTRPEHPLLNIRGLLPTAFDGVPAKGPVMESVTSKWSLKYRKVLWTCCGVFMASVCTTLLTTNMVLGL